MIKYTYLLLAAMVSLPLQAQQAVKVKPFSEIAVSRTYQLPASVVNLQLAAVASEASGRIIQFDVLEGDSVEQGQTLLTLDCTFSRIELNRATAGLKRLEANRKLTEQQLKRAQGLVKSRSISRDELDQRQTQLDADNASIEEQRAQLQAANRAVSDCELKAPFSGVVIEKLSAQGSYANPGVTMLTLLKQEAVELDLELPVDRLPDLQQAEAISFITNGDTYPVELRRILPLVNPTSLQQQVRLRFLGNDLPDGGSFGTLTFQSPRAYLPTEYIVKRDGQFGVFISQQQKADFIPLQQVQEGQSAKVTLATDTQVIIDRLKLLQPGDSIKITP